MSDISVEQLVDSVEVVLQRVESGEEFTLSADGRAVARLSPVTGRIRWMARDDFAARVSANLADESLTSELLELLPDSTDRLPLR